MVHNNQAIGYDSRGICPTIRAPCLCPTISVLWSADKHRDDYLNRFTNSKETNRETNDENTNQKCYDTKKLGNQWGKVTDSPRALPWKKDMWEFDQSFEKKFGIS